MELIFSLAALLGALAIGAMSPGPSFVLVARTAIASSRGDALAAAVGMGIGGVMFSVLVLLGLSSVLVNVPWLYLFFKLAGGTYLIYLGASIWLGAKQSLVVEMPVEGSDSPIPGTLHQSFLTALGVQISNPKTAIVYGSIFAALLPRELPQMMVVALPVLVFIIEAGWYAIVAIALSSESPRAAYLEAKTVIDRLAGSVLGFLGLKLVFSEK